MKTLYIYENHLDGGYYITDRELSYEETYCEDCGDSDWLVAKIKNEKDITSFDNSHKFLRCDRCKEFVYQSDRKCFKCGCEQVSQTRTYEDTIDAKYFKKFIAKLKKIAKENYE